MSHVQLIYLSMHLFSVEQLPQPVGQSPASTVVVAPTQVVRRTERLGDLSPARPIAYFELAEEIAADSVSVEDRDLARHLHVLALIGATRKSDSVTPAPADSPLWLGSSAALALAALADNEQDRRWLAALAGTLAPEDVRLTVQRLQVAAAIDPAALELASALGALRFGDGRRASKLLERAPVAALLDRYERLLSADGSTGGAARVRSLVAKFPTCPECQRKRYVKDKDGVRLCPTCGGRPGPKVDGEELVGQLRLESLLLSGVQRSWAAQVVADDGAPLRELDPEAVADAYRVDADKLWWREGRWVADPSSSLKP